MHTRAIRVLVCLLLAMSLVAAGESVAVDRAVEAQPNIIVINTDDMSLEELRWMPKLRRQLGRYGVSFDTSLAPNPLCCPARVELMTGQYGQNSGTNFNVGTHGGFASFAAPENSLGPWLESAGYSTAMIGKYLNGYDYTDEVRQPGWTVWNPTIDGTLDYLNTTFYNDGEPETPEGNVTDVIAGYTNGTVQDLAAVDKPFFMWVSHIAPHAARYWEPGSEPRRKFVRREAKDFMYGPPIPSERHDDVLLDVKSPTLGKPSFRDLRTGSQMYGDQARQRRASRTQSIFTERIQSLQDVDDAIESLVRTLDEAGELDETYIFFTSDNGHQLGEHGRVGKSMLFRESVEVPLVVRVPGAAATTSRSEVSLVDVPATILDLADVTPGRVLDGTSFAPILAGEPQRWRDTQLIHTGAASRGPEMAWELQGVRTRRFSYIERVSDGRVWVFDRRLDPYETRNFARSSRYADVRAELKSRLKGLDDCAGVECTQSFGRLPRVPR